MSAARRVVMTVVATTAMSVILRRVMTGVDTAVTSAVLLGGMTVGLLSGMSGRRLGVKSGLGIRVGLGLGLLGMGGLLGSRVARVPGRGAMTGLGPCRVATTGPGTKSRRLGTTVDRVGTTGPGLGVKSVAAAGGTSVTTADSGVRTRRRSVRARTTRSFRPGSPVRSSTVG
jgi:hypothetical protein